MSSSSVNNVRTQFSLWADGRAYLGGLSEFNAPKLTETYEDFRGGGMDTPVSIRTGTEKLTADFTLISYEKEVLKLWGLALSNTKQFTVNEALDGPDGTTQLIHNMTGRISEIDAGTSKAGTVPTLKVSLVLTYYKLTQGGQTIVELDPVNFVRTINGTDTLSSVRSALGI